jgi:hypothetical protein
MTELSKVPHHVAVLPAAPPRRLSRWNALAYRARAVPAVRRRRLHRLTHARSNLLTLEPAATGGLPSFAYRGASLLKRKSRRAAMKRFDVSS